MSHQGYLIGEIDGYEVFVTEALRDRILIAGDESEQGLGSADREFIAEVMAAIDDHLDAVVFAGLTRLTCWIADPVDLSVEIISTLVLMISIPDLEVAQW
jgi:hypothetical protein